MRSPTRGNLGEAAVLNALVQRGLDVLLPFGGGHPYDLVVEAGGVFLRIQCKTAWKRGGCLVFNSLSTDHGRGRMSYVGSADVFGVYFPPNDGVYIVPIDAIARTEGRLRLAPTLNNQRRRVRLAADFEIEKWSTRRLLSVRSNESMHQAASA